MESLEYNCKRDHSGWKVLLPKGRNLRGGECLGLAGLKTANSVELISVTGSLLRTLRNLFSRWNDSKGCKGNNGKTNDIKGTYFFI